MSLLALARKMERAERRRQAEARERIQAERAAREVQRLRKVAELEASGKAAKLSGVDREAEQLFELVCDRPGITRTQALGVVPSEAGWDDLVACSDIELVATGAESEPGAFSAVRLIHARDSIMKTLRAARGAWVSVRELRDATPYSNGYRAAAIKTLGLIEHDGRNRYRRKPMNMPCTHPENWPCSHDSEDCSSQKVVDARIAIETGTAVTDFEPRPQTPGVEYVVEIEESPVADESTVEFWRKAQRRS